MNAVVRALFSFFLILPFNVSLFAQKPVRPPAPPETPRQALIEILKGGEKGLMKHLTVEVQQLLSETKSRQRLLPLGMFSALGSEPGLEVETFETGPVLLSVNSPKEHQKFEVNVNTDDLRGDQDTLELSFHMFRDGEEQEPEWQPLLSHFVVTLVQQKEIWRLSKISVGADFAIGDPEFLKKTVLKGAEKETAPHPQEGRAQSHGEGEEPSQPVNMPVEQLIMMLGFAEQSYAGRHPDVGFTCSLAELAEAGKGFGLDPQIATGVYKGYKISLTGCQGRPAGSFQVIAEPMATAGKAYCTDATRNIRVADDGRGVTCLVAGRSTRVAVPDDEDEAVGVDLGSTAAPAKPKDQ